MTDYFQVGEELYETEAQQMVRNKLRNELENITIKFLLSTMKPLDA